MNSVRAFIAVTLDEETKDELAKIQETLRKELGSEVRWTRPQATHLTLKFLGNIKTDDLPGVYEAASRAAYRKPFLFSLGGIGGFPSISSPRVIWIGVKRGREEMETLAGDLETELSKVGYPREKRKFSPHLTLGRVKKPLKLHLQFNQLPVTSYQLPATKIEVIKSDLRPDGAVYSCLKEFHFKLQN